MEFLEALTFIERGVVAGVLIGIIAPLIGSFLVVRRVSVISESLSHVTLTGISAAVLLSQTLMWVEGLNPLYFGALFALVGSLLIEKLRQEYHHFQELAIPIILSAGIGLSAVFISMAESGYNEWFSYLFGSIVSVTLSDLYFILITSGVVLTIVILMYKELLAVSFDQEFAKVTGISVRSINFLFSVLVALVIALSMQVVGILLVGALITLPVAAAIRIGASFRSIIIYSIIFGELAVLLGVYFSYHLNIATGGTIVMTAITILFVVSLGKRLWQWTTAA
ncbi:metal ABC transporter permease [Salsuginibacillus kocurii]|uniref:metal ABC transporter permease n=1 Tax=Salsuginibacillus kocurii TaxID=427078 RepID=UPI0003615FF7|nr:metal ABC transporter permease [Salsuginibacillus kocurii]